MSIKREPGFTLIEALMANAMVIIVVAVTYQLWNASLANFDSSVTNFQLSETSDLVCRSMARELRQASEAIQGSYPLEILADNNLAFYADSGGDGVVERIRYYVSGTNLMRGVVQPTGNPPAYNIANEQSKLLLSNVLSNSGPIFSYYNSNWPADTTNNPLSVSQRQLETKFIKISIPIQMNSAEGVASTSAEILVQLRNLKYDL